MKETSTKAGRTGSKRWLSALALAASTLLAACGGGGGGESVQAKNAPDGGEARLVSTRLCDPSGCYIAWRVVDSDGDGVCDADEWAAGTDPNDPKSKPTLLVVAELGGKSLLPSFEYGSGVFTVYPEKMQEQFKEFYKGQSVLEQAMAFPFAKDRGDALKRMGVNSDLLKEFGIELDRGDGFTLGLEHKSKDDPGIPARRVGGVDIRWISGESGEDDPVPLPEIKPTKKVEGFADGGTKTTYMDGSSRTKQADGTIVLRNEDNKITKVYPGPNVKYTNPDADTGTGKPTDEQMKAFERLRGAAIRTLDGWASGPDVKEDDIEAIKKRKNTIILVDPAIMDGFQVMYDAPRVTGAQPETRPDLPNPEIPSGGVPGGGPNGGCPVRGYGDC